MQPETHYARSGAVHIAYQVLGGGPHDLVFVPGFISNIDHYWSEPTIAHFLTRLAQFSRVILFDKRGTGLSDRVGSLPTLEERMDDVRAVMDAAGSKRAAIFGVSEGGAMSLLFAATYPERCSALALYGAYPHFFSYVLPQDRFEAFIARIDEHWGTGASLTAFAPSKVGDARFTAWWAGFERLGASPSAVIALMRMNTEIDVRQVLPAIRTPTLVIHRVDDTRVNVEGGRSIANGIAGARYLELPGRDHLLWAGDVDVVADSIEELVTGSSSKGDVDRVLTTILFTDIVDSTGRLTEVGDHAWKELIEQHDHAVRQQLTRYQGREVKTLGDGFLVTFDGPARAIRCAGAIIDAVRPLGLAIRSGVHTGEVEIKGSDIAGIAVNTAARVSSAAGPGEVLVSGTVRDLVAGSGIRFADFGPCSLKGIDDGVRLYRVS